MYNIPKVNFNVVEKSQKKGVFEITPLVKGFGYTIGSAIRRTLYSSTMGAAITKVSVDGVSHEFTTIDGVKDDVFQILLNLKRVRFIKEIEEPVDLEIDVKGPAIVTAADIEKAAGLEVVNKELVITELADAKSKFKAKITVESGYGYKEVNESETTAKGVIKLDASFSPIVNVVVNVEETLVGRDADYDKLTLTVETDGSVDVENVVRNSAKVLKEFFYKVQTGEEYKPVEDEAMAEVNAEGAVVPAQLPADEVALEELHLPTRTINALRKAGIKTLGDLADRSEDDLLRVRNLGEKSIREIVALLEKEGLK